MLGEGCLKKCPSAAPQDEGGEQENLLQVSTGEDRSCHKQTSRLLPAIRGQEDLPPSAVQAASALNMSQFANPSYMSYVMAEEKILTNLHTNYYFFFFIYCEIALLQP